MRSSSQNVRAFFVAVSMFYIPFILLSACATLRPSSVPAGGLYRLELKPTTTPEKTSYVSRSISQTLANGVMKEQSEETRFTTVSRFLKSHSETQALSFNVKTLSSKGPARLHDLGFPNVDEDVVMTFKKSGEVLQAGDFPKDSVFYLPPVPLPSEPVAIGDTWEYKGNWVGDQTGWPFNLEMVLIFKDVKPCGPQACAVLEVSGQVTLGLEIKEVKFQGDITGHLYFGLETGSLIKADMKSMEVLKLDDQAVRVSSCLGSEVIEPKSHRVSNSKEAHCEWASFDN